MKAGTQVRVVVPTIEGVVKGRRFNDADELELLVEFTEGSEVHQRWYAAEQLEALPAAEEQKP